MEDIEIYIFIYTEEKRKYILDIPKSIKYISLKEKIKKAIIHSSHFYIVYNSKKYDTNNNSEILNLNQGDTIYTYMTITLCPHYCCFHHERRNFKEKDNKKLELSGILKLFLLLFISKKMDNIEKIKSDEIRNIILELKNNINLINFPKKGIKSFFSHKFKKNIITFKNYIKEKINDKEIQYLFNLFDKEAK